MTAEQLAALLRLDFRPSDLGDTADQFTTRLQGITEAAVQRPDTTAIQQEAGRVTPSSARNSGSSRASLNG